MGNPIDVASYDVGFNTGYGNGYNDGLDDGYQRGYQEAYAEQTQRVRQLQAEILLLEARVDAATRRT